MEKIDKKDKKILAVLNQNGRASVSEIARKTGIPRDSVHYRLQRLIKLKIIRFFHTVLDTVALGCPIFSYVNLVLSNFDEVRENKFYQYLRSHNNVVYVAKTMGKWDCIIAVAAQNLEKFDSVLRDIRREFSDIIKDVDTAAIIHEHKYDSMVELIS